MVSRGATGTLLVLVAAVTLLAVTGASPALTRGVVAVAMSLVLGWWGSLLQHTALMAARLRAREQAAASATAPVDERTGLPDGGAFLDLLDETVARRGSAAVALVRLEGFTALDTALAGHDGHPVASAVRARLESALGWEEQVARVDDDTFGLVLPRIVSPAVARGRAVRLLDSLRAPLDVGALELHLPLVCGTALLGAPADEPGQPDGRAVGTADVLRHCVAALDAAAADPAGIAVHVGAPGSDAAEPLLSPQTTEALSVCSTAQDVVVSRWAAAPADAAAP